MPRAKTTPCNRCGELMATSLSEGKARCHPCRRIETQHRPGSIRGGAEGPLHLAVCEWCGWMFETKRTKQRFCTMACLGKSNQVRSDDDPHQQRCEREKNAPGLSGAQRSRLLKKWKRQGKSCTYCDELATTVDHVVPLVRGGTNYEGNLTPACKHCNSSKTYFTVIEWRTGKRLPRMGRALAWEIRRKAVAKVKPPRVTHLCPLCATPTTRKVYCSTACAREWWGRKTRDKYRATHGLAVDVSAPSASWKSHSCPVCSTLTMRQIYCSPDCSYEGNLRRVRAYKAAHRAA